MHGGVDLKKYALLDASWMKSIRVCSFVINTWAFDQRPSVDRLAHPKVLDYGVATGDAPDLDQMKGVTHFALDRNIPMQETKLKSVNHRAFILRSNKH